MSERVLSDGILLLVILLIILEVYVVLTLIENYYYTRIYVFIFSTFLLWLIKLVLVSQRAFFNVFLVVQRNVKQK